MRGSEVVAVLFSMASIATLSSCGQTFRIDQIVEGEFSGITEENGAKFRYTLRLERISQEAYLAADGINVIRDAIAGSCFSFHLTRVDQNSFQIEYFYSGFYDPNPSRNDLPIRYTNDQGAWFSPYTTTAFDEPRRPKQCGYYFVQPEKDGLEPFSVYLHARGASNE